MPTPATAKWPRPKSEDEWEEMVLDAMRLRWHDPNAHRNGRRGQGQNGVDIFGCVDSSTVAAQAKNMDKITETEVRAEIRKAEQFKPALTEFHFAIAGPRNGSRVRGDARADSDYDIAVFLKDLNDRWAESDKIALAAMNIFDETGALIHAMPYREGTYQERTPLMLEIQNLHLLLSHRNLYGTVRSIDDILDRPISADLLCLLSILAFENDEEKRFRSWAASSLTVFEHQPVNESDNMHTRVVFGRIQIFECWKQLLARSGTLEIGKQNGIELSGMLHELFARINDHENDGDPHQHLIKTGIHFSRDDYLFKLYRAQKIFLDGQRLASYVAAFERQQGFELESYLGVIFAILVRCHLKRRVERFDPLDLDGWCVDLDEMHQDMEIDFELLRTIMNSIAFTLDEGIAFARGDVDSTGNFELFRSRPFLKLSETCFLPIAGKLVEELLFDNLLHRLHFASGRDIQFHTMLGYDFERYTQSLIEDFCASSTGIAYECIPEFTYGKANVRSPDAMVRCEQDQTLLAFEVKSARYLDSILTTDNAPEVVADSFNKLRDKPWKQVHDAIERIVDEHRHAKLTEGLRYLFVAVTMNEIPHSLQDYRIQVHGRDVSHCFHSFGIHTLELLLIAASLSSEYTLYDMLLNAFHARNRISTRTAVIRFLRAHNSSSPFFTKIRDHAIRRHRASLDRYTSKNPG